MMLVKSLACRSECAQIHLRADSSALLAQTNANNRQSALSHALILKTNQYIRTLWQMISQASIQYFSLLLSSSLVLRISSGGNSTHPSSSHRRRCVIPAVWLRPFAMQTYFDFDGLLFIRFRSVLACVCDKSSFPFASPRIRVRTLIQHFRRPISKRLSVEDLLRNQRQRRWQWFRSVDR